MLYRILIMFVRRLNRMDILLVNRCNCIGGASESISLCIIKSRSGEHPYRVRELDVLYPHGCNVASSMDAMRYRRNLRAIYVCTRRWCRHEQFIYTAQCRALQTKKRNKMIFIRLTLNKVSCCAWLEWSVVFAHTIVRTVFIKVYLSSSICVRQLVDAMHGPLFFYSLKEKKLKRKRHQQ